MFAAAAVLLVQKEQRKKKKPELSAPEEVISVARCYISLARPKLSLKCIAKVVTQLHGFVIKKRPFSNLQP
jgi:hypothetical protein